MGWFQVDSKSNFVFEFYYINQNAIIYSFKQNVAVFGMTIYSKFCLVLFGSSNIMEMIILYYIAIDQNIWSPINIKVKLQWLCICNDIVKEN